MTCTCGYKTGGCIGTSDCIEHYAKVPCYQPKGSMCTACVHAGDDCSGFDWAKMPVYQKIDNVVIVICKKFVKKAMIRVK